MSELWDKLAAKGRGAAQVATAGAVDDIYPKILANLPFDDKTGIPREYASGSAENDYRNEYKADDADLARRYPRNFMDGGLLMGGAQMAATGGLGAGGQVVAGTGMGAAQGYGGSENTGWARIKDAIRGGAVSGGVAATGNLAASAAPAAKAAFEKLRQGPPPGLQPALAGSSALRAVPRPVEPMGGPQINRMVPPRPTSADLTEFTPETASQTANRAAARGSSPSVPPVDMSRPLPRNPALKTRTTTLVHPETGEAAEAIVPERVAEQTEASIKKSVRPGAKKGEEGMSAKERAAKRKAAQSPAPEQGAQIVPIRQEAPAPRPELTAANKPLIGPKQLPDDRILELARQGREAAGPQAPQGAQGLSPEQLEAGKQQLRDQFKKMAGGGNVVQHEGALQVADDPFIAGRVRELQQHVKSAEAAGDSDVAESLRNQIEELLAAPTEQLGKAQTTDFLKKYGK